MSETSYRFGVCPAGFHSCFGPIFPHCGLFCFQMGKRVLCHCMLQRYKLFSDFTRSHSEEIALSERKDFGHLNSVGAVIHCKDH